MRNMLINMVNKVICATFYPLAFEAPGVCRRGDWLGAGLASCGQGRVQPPAVWRPRVTPGDVSRLETPATLSQGHSHSGDGDNLPGELS